MKHEAPLRRTFATVLLADSSRVLAAAGVPEADAPRILLPLAVQSLRNAATSPPDALTGPAARGDEDVVRAHREALAEAELTALLSLYDILCDRAAALVVDRGRRRG